VSAGAGGIVYFLPRHLFHPNSVGMIRDSGNRDISAVSSEVAVIQQSLLRRPEAIAANGGIEAVDDTS
jgi:hypothetical protein